MFTNKKIIFGAPKEYGLSAAILRELLHLGFEVIDISFYQHKFKYKNFGEFLEKLYFKHIRGQKDYKTYLKFRHNSKWMTAKIDTLGHADFALIIRPDHYPKWFIEKISGKSSKMIAYQWDGIERYPNVKSYISLFDRFFVFDLDEVKMDNVLPTTNFYNESFPNLIAQKDHFDVYYIGYLIRSRAKVLEDIIGALQKMNLNIKLHLVSKSLQKKTWLETVKTTMPYEDNLYFSAVSRILVDVVNPIHRGLSLRVLESIGFGKKLITTNLEIAKYDFYHPHNILIWGQHSHEELLSFVSKPYAPLPTAIREKYGFFNWIKYLLDEGDYLPIELPKFDE